MLHFQVLERRLDINIGFILRNVMLYLCFVEAGDIELNTYTKIKVRWISTSVSSGGFVLSQRA